MLLSGLLAPLALILTSLSRYALVILAFVTPLLTISHDDTDLVTTTYVKLLGMPPLLVIALLAGAIAIPKLTGQVQRRLAANMVPLLVFLAVLLIELILTVVVESPMPFLLGRLGFYAIILAVVMNADTPRTVHLALQAFTAGAAVLGLLTILHAFDIYSLPIAMNRLAVRSFYGLHLPVARTLGIAMSFGKFGIISSLAIAVVVFSIFSDRPIIRSRSLRHLYLLLLLSAVIISQGRAVYLTVAVTIACSVILARQLHGHKSRNSRSSIAAAKLLAWCGLPAILIIVNLSQSETIADWEIFYVGNKTGSENISGRVMSNRTAIELFAQHPLLGHGHGVNSGRYGGSEAVHNHFLEHFVATGLVGGLPYLAFHFLILWQAIQIMQKREFADIGGVLLVGTLATIIEYQFFPGFFTEAFAVICGLVIAQVGWSSLYRTPIAVR